MLRQILVVLLSAIIGSLLGTLAMSVLHGGFETDGVTLGFAMETLMFTFPGAVVLMWATTVIAARGYAMWEAQGLLAVAGFALGSVMLGSINLQMASSGALYEGITALSFGFLLRAFKAYGRNGERLTSHRSSRSRQP